MNKRSYFASFILHNCPVLQGVGKDFLKIFLQPRRGDRSLARGAATPGAQPLVCGFFYEPESRRDDRTDSNGTNG